MNPAFFASVTDNGFSFIGELNVENTFRTGFLHAGHFVNGFADSGRFNVNFPPHAAQFPSHNSYSYNGTTQSLRLHPIKSTPPSSCLYPRLTNLSFPGSDFFPLFLFGIQLPPPFKKENQNAPDQNDDK